MRTRNPITVLGPDGRPLAGASVMTRDRGTGADATVYAAETGGGPGSNPAITDAQGRVVQWVERGRYASTITATGLDPRVDEWESAPGAPGAIDTAWIGDSQVTAAKVADGTIATADLADLAVATGKLANAAATSPKVAPTMQDVGLDGYTIASATPVDLPGSTTTIVAAVPSRVLVAITITIECLFNGGASDAYDVDIRLNVNGVDWGHPLRDFQGGAALAWGGHRLRSLHQTVLVPLAAGSHTLKLRGFTGDKVNGGASQWAVYSSSHYVTMLVAQ